MLLVPVQTKQYWALRLSVPTWESAETNSEPSPVGATAADKSANAHPVIS